MAHKDTLSSDDVLALELARGKSVTDAARGAGIARRTVYRRLSDPAFRRRVGEIRSDLVHQAAGMLATAMTTAVTTLQDLLTHASPTIRLKAPRELLNTSTKLNGEGELEGRLTVLEETIRGWNP